MLISEHRHSGNSNIINISGNFTVLDVCKALPIYVPGSAGNYADLATQTLYCANECFRFLQRLVNKIGKTNLQILRIEAFASHPSVAHGLNAADAALELKKLFDRYGSDKANIHKYHLIYGPILKDRKAISGLLEIGLGTNNIDVVSNMGTAGKPGASLRAFRDFLPQASVYGADIDNRILFEEERIKTCYVDQTNLGSFDALHKLTPNRLDLIIDDGLHAPNANIAVLIFGLDKLKDNGWLIIEDIQPFSLPVWHVIAALLPDTYECFLIEEDMNSVFAVKKRPVEAV